MVKWYKYIKVVQIFKKYEYQFFLLNWDSGRKTLKSCYISKNGIKDKIDITLRGLKIYRLNCSKIKSY